MNTKSSPGATAGQRAAVCPQSGAGTASADPQDLGLNPDDLPDGLVVADETGRVVCFNAAAARITALRPADVLGLPIDRALPLEDLEGRRWWTLTDPYGGLAIRRGQPERNLLLPGGREVLVSARYVREHPRGPVRRLVVAIRGTESRRRTERSHAELIATVAHELRSPLTSVKGFTATLLAKWERFTDDQKKLMLETVDADANRVTRLIAELLDISRIDSGRLEVRRQPVDVGAAVRHRVDAHIAAGAAADRFRILARPDAARAVGGPRQARAGARQPAGKRGAARRRNRHHRAGAGDPAGHPRRARRGRDGRHRERRRSRHPRGVDGPRLHPLLAGQPSAAAPALGCTSSRASSRPTAARSPSAGRPAAAPGSDSSCPSGRRPSSAEHPTGRPRPSTGRSHGVHQLIGASGTRPR